MPTVVPVTVRPASHPDGAGDYTSINAAVAGEARDLVAADEICRMLVYAHEDTSRVVVSGFTTGPDHPVEIIGVEGDPGPYIDSGGYVNRATQGTIGYGNAAFEVQQDYFLCRNLQIDRVQDWWPAAHAFRSAPESATGNDVGLARWDGCVARVVQTAGAMDELGACLTTSSRQRTMWRNCLAIAREDGGSLTYRGIDQPYSGTAWARVVALHCAADTTGPAYHLGTDGSGSAVVVRNSYERGGGLSFNGPTTFQSNRRTSSGPAGWTAGTPEIEERWTDYRLLETDTVCLDAGVDLSADADWPVDVDISGTSRPQGDGWDIGPWERPDDAAPAPEGGSEASVVVAATGGGTRTASGGAAAAVTVTGTGGGTRTALGGSAAPVSVTATGEGTRTALGGSDASVAVAAVGAGTTTRAGGAVADVEVTATGGGSIPAQGGSVAEVAVTATGGGTRTASGGAVAEVMVTATGGGALPAQGGSVAAVVVAATGGGTRMAAGGSVAAVAVAAVAAGTRTALGGAVAHVMVTATGGGGLAVPGAVYTQVAGGWISTQVAGGWISQLRGRGWTHQQRGTP